VAIIAALRSISTRANLWFITLQAVLLSTIIVPPPLHWISTISGWLSPLNNSHTRPIDKSFVIDLASITSVNLIGGSFGFFSNVFLLRRSKDTLSLRPSLRTTVPFSSMLGSLGVLLVFAGWLGLLSTARTPDIVSENIVIPHQLTLGRSAVNLILSSSAAIFVGYLFPYIVKLFGHTIVQREISLYNCFIACAVAISAISPFVGPLAAVLVGVIACIVNLVISYFLQKYGYTHGQWRKLDDPLQGCAVHFASAVVGLLLLPLVYNTEMTEEVLLVGTTERIWIFIGHLLFVIITVSWTLIFVLILWCAKRIMAKLVRLFYKREDNIYCISTELEEWGPDWYPKYANLSYAVFKNLEKNQELAFKLH